LSIVIGETIFSAVTSDPSTHHPELSLQLEFRPGEQSIRGMRAMLRTLLSSFGFPEEGVEGVVLGADEALMNAWEHGNCQDASSTIGLTIELSADRLLLEVLDRGEGEAPSAGDSALPEHDSERGRGLFLIHQVMDEVKFLPREGGGTRVQLVKHR
jgi:anti-sigma regulatory factor (Ser/Thr protein kinase)